MRPLIILLPALLLAFPTALASHHVDGYLIAGYPVSGTPSGVGVQISDNFAVALHHGDSISADLAWFPIDPNNDLDLVLLLPSGAPVPIDTNDPVGTVERTAGSRVARETCTDMAAKSISHSGSTESLAFTVPATGEEGTYTLAVRGWILLTNQDYGLDATATSGAGGDLSGTIVDPAANQAFLTSAPHCQM